MTENTISENRVLTIYFGTELANLYDVGYLTTDLFQLFAFSESMSTRAIEDAEMWFGNKNYMLNRYASVFQKYKNQSQILEAKKGSLELTVAVCSLLSSIIIPLVVVYIQRNLGQRSIAFEVSVEDQRIQQMINAFASGRYGEGPNALERLFSELRDSGYSVTLQAQDAYVINDVLQRYSQRMVRTINKP